MIVSTTNEIVGYRVVRHLGLVRGITVRSRSVVGNFFGGLQTIFGGKLSVYVNLAEATPGRKPSTTCANMRLRAGPTPSSACATTPMKSWTG